MPFNLIGPRLEVKKNMKGHLKNDTPMMIVTIIFEIVDGGGGFERSDYMFKGSEISRIPKGFFMAFLAEITGNITVFLFKCYIPNLHEIKIDEM